MLLKQNLVAWEEDFGEFLQEYKITKNAEALLASVDNLIARFKIEPRPRSGVKQLDRSSLEVVGYIFLSKSTGEFPLLVGASDPKDNLELGGQTKFGGTGGLAGDAALSAWSKPKG
jgi:hypothetical protein